MSKHISEVTVHSSKGVFLGVRGVNSANCLVFELLNRTRSP